jgi:radical SAM protein with 4Fe4S-binding SPASM domain
MTEEPLSKEDTFLKAVFSERSWETYRKRAKILSSPDPGSWDFIEFPLEIALELSNHCNLRCVMCPVPDLKRKRGFMGEPVFHKTVEHLLTESGFIFLPQGFGESLLHPRWAQFIHLAGAMGIQPITVLTNGMLLSGERTTAVLENVDIVVITLDGSDAKTYESVRVNGSFERVTGNIHNLLQSRGNSETPHCVIRIIRMQDTESGIEAFRASWEKVIGKGDLIQVSECIDWAGSVKYRGVIKNRRLTERQPCRMLWKNLTVYHDGRVSPCCYDAEGELIVGDILNQSPREIWNSPELRNLRALHLTSHYEKLPICSRCVNWL